MNLKQLLSSFIIKLLQKFGPKKVKVLGKTYIISKEVFNPKFYFTSSFMAKHINITPKQEVLDIGTGSGIQAITAASIAKKVTAIDINPEAAQCTKKNIKNLKNITILQGDLFSPLSPKSQFDVILFTPPYFEKKPKTKFDYALYDPKKSLIKRFFKQAKKHLKPHGYIQMVYSSIADPKLVLKIAKKSGWKHKIITKKKSLFETFFIYKFTLTKD